MVMLGTLRGLPVRARSALADGELRILAVRAWRAFPALIKSALPILAWSAAAVIAGLLIGAMVVILPPMAAIGTVGMAGVVLLWAMPELRWVPKASLRKAFFSVVFVELSVPAYYAVQVAGLPWISARRLVVFVLIFLFSVAIAGSRSARERIVNVLAYNKPLAMCVIGYIVMAFISIFTSAYFPESMSQFLEITLNWYVPFFACLLVISSESDVLILYRLIALLTIFVAMLGVAEFITQHRLAIDIIPKSLLTKMMEDNPSLAGMVNSDPFRNGFYRASSIYSVPLSFGELAAMVGPIGGYFLLHGDKWRDRVLGVAVLVAALLSLFVSGSRGGAIGFLIAMPVLTGLWIVRYSRMHPRSLVGAIAGTITLLGTAAMIALVFLWGRLHNIVLGGGEATSSSDARLEQWRLAWPHIQTNPLTGHGVGMAADVVSYQVPGGGYTTLDSYVLTLLVETGVTGLLFFFGIILFAMWACARFYLSDLDKRAALGGPLACSFLAFGLYRLVLSQRENHTLFFLLVGLTFIFVKLAFERKATKDAAAFSSNSADGRR
jgi:hypothetical protein